MLSSVTDKVFFKEYLFSPWDLLLLPFFLKVTPSLDEENFIPLTHHHALTEAEKIPLHEIYFFFDKRCNQLVKIKTFFLTRNACTLQ